MSGKLFVHIGLPKTATTTLQREIFPKLSGDHIQYLGVYQPRKDTNQTVFFEQFCQIVYSGDGIDELARTLSEMLESGATYVLSEEMLTVSSGNASWQAKLTNLAKLLNGLDYSILVTVREPTAAMFSYYIELYEQFSRRKRASQMSPEMTSGWKFSITKRSLKYFSAISIPTEFLFRGSRTLWAVEMKNFAVSSVPAVWAGMAPSPTGTTNRGEPVISFIRAKSSR